MTPPSRSIVQIRPSRLPFELDPWGGSPEKLDNDHIDLNETQWAVPDWRILEKKSSFEANEELLVGCRSFNALDAPDSRARRGLATLGWTGLDQAST